MAINQSLILFLPIIVFIVLSLLPNLGSALWISVFDSFNISVFLAAFFVLALFSILIFLPFILIWHAFSRPLKKGAIEQATHINSADIPYYREKLIGLSSTDISLFTDLAIEIEKDISASILNYKMMGLISTQGDQIIVNSQTHPDLNPSDTVLLQMLAQGHLSPEGIAKWKRAAIREAIDKGYITSVFSSDSIKKASSAL